ncbi:hypothetical protein ABTP07_19415, partial [Acinetobacter baumannii]
GWMTMRPVRTGSRVFIGNDAVLPPGGDIPDGALLGLKSTPPTDGPMQPGETRFGSPPIMLPVRQRFDGSDADKTFEPPFWRRVMRA